MKIKMLDEEMKKEKNRVNNREWYRIRKAIKLSLQTRELEKKQKEIDKHHEMMMKCREAVLKELREDNEIRSSL